MVVVDELHHPRLQVHIDVKVRIAGHGRDGVDRLALDIGQPGRLGVLLAGLDVLRDELDEQPPVELGEDILHVVRLGPLGLFAAMVPRQLAIEHLDKVGAGGHQLVVDRHHIGHARQAAAGRRAQAHQPDEVRAVGMVVKGDAADLVAARIAIVRLLALVGDIAQQVAMLVLRPGIAQMRAQTPVDQGELIVRVVASIHPGDPGKAAPVDQFALDVGQLGDKAMQRKFIAPDVQYIQTLRLHAAHGRLNLAPVLIIQGKGPCRGIGDIGGAPVDVGLQRAGREGHGRASSGRTFLSLTGC